VHGAFADGTSWRRVIPMVKKAGLDVISVQLPLDTLDRDVAFTERAVDLAEAPVVLVGHDWGGMDVTEAGLHPKVKSLVYIAAYIPTPASRSSTRHAATQSYRIRRASSEMLAAT
jgi:pimeloyl-ACP methyl ester carboxylesterase